MKERISVSGVIDANKEVSFLNILKKMIWERKDLGNVLDKTLDNMHDMYYDGSMEMDIDFSKLKKIFINYLKSFKDRKIFDKWLKRS
jgi:hypothetical protein